MAIFSIRKQHNTDPRQDNPHITYVATLLINRHKLMTLETDPDLFMSNPSHGFINPHKRSQSRLLKQHPFRHNHGKTIFRTKRKKTTDKSHDNEHLVPALPLIFQVVFGDFAE